MALLGHAVPMMMIVVVGMTVRADIPAGLHRHRRGCHMGGGAMRCDDDKRRNDQRKGGRQRDEAARRMQDRAMDGLLDQT